ncbi:MAG: PQQ-binding-like beta-propeller repeat protein [Paracoccaceae bacterium]
MANMTQDTGRKLRFPRAALAAGAVLSAFLLSACNDGNEILVGQREELRDVLQDADSAVVVENTERAISLGPATSNANWAQFFGSPAVRTAHPALSAAPSLAWRNDIGQGNTRKLRISADPVVGGGRIYTLDAGAQVTATSPAGATLWTRNLAPSIEGAGDATGGGVAYADGRLYVGIGFGTLTALDAGTGEVVWTQNLDASATGAPTIAGDLVYLAAGDDTGWALNKDTGRVAWQIGGAQDVNNVLGAPSPVVTQDLAIFSFGAGDIQAVFRRGGLRRWDANVVGERRGFALSKIGDITAPPVVDGTQVYVGNQSGRVAALSLGNGSRIWTANEGAIGPIWPAGDSVFFVTDRNELVRLDASDGSRIWGVRLPNFVKDRPRRRSEVFAHFGPVVAGGRVVLTSSDGVMRSYDPKDGTLLGRVEIPSGAATAPALAGGSLYLVNTKGELLAFR